MRTAAVFALTFGLVILLSLPALEAASNYTNPFLRTPNYTIDIDKTPADSRNPPKITPPQLRSTDVIVPAPGAPVRLDPRTCPGEIALCYQVLSSNYTLPITRGKNFTNVGNYTFPYRRARFFACAGNDTRCVSQARGCSCFDTQPVEPVVFTGSDRCTDTTHQCEVAPGFVTLCDGNLTTCRAKYDACGCGRHATCVSAGTNTCLNDRNELFGCKGTLAECLVRYESCSCGREAIASYRLACDAPRSRCELAGAKFLCEGSFQSCALQYDRCTCGDA